MLKLPFEILASRLPAPVMALTFCLVASGCAVINAPGFDYAQPSPRSSISLGPGGSPVEPDAGSSPATPIQPITPSLLQALAAATPRVAPSELTEFFKTPTPYTIGPSDIIFVNVFGHPDLLPNSGAVITQMADPTGVSPVPGFIVDSRGDIPFPFIGRVNVLGLTEVEASDLLGKRLAKYLKDPQVTVRIASFRSRRAYIDGEVRTPGMVIFTDVPTTLPEAINRAGGISAAGDRSNVVITRGSKSVNVDLQRLQELGINPNRILLENGDQVTVRNREDSKVFVMGEIARPSALLMRNGRLTLNEALGEAGGPNLGSANTGQIYVIRANATAAPAIFHLNASNPTALALAEGFSLRPRDVVYVDPVPLVNWNRIISLILPSANAVNIGSQVLTR